MYRLSSAVLLILLGAGSSGGVFAQPTVPAPDKGTTTPFQSVCAKSFQQVDINNDGVLTRDDVAKVDPQTRFIEHADTNNDAMVTVAEFNAGCSKNLFRKLRATQQN
jgi:hypothetical protein